MVTQEKVKGFFADVEGDQGTGSQPLLPTRTKDGAPKDNKWLMHFVEDQVEVMYAKSDGHPYLGFRAEIDEPAEYSGRQVFGMFFMPRTGGDDEAKYQEQMGRVVGQIDGVLGVGTCAGLESDTLESSLFELVPMLENVTFVGKIGLEKGKKRDPSDESHDAERYPDRNRIVRFEPEDTWAAR